MNKRLLILLGFIAAKFILQYLLVSPAYDLQRDEYLHLDQGRHLAWGYISVPPVTSWISYVIRLLGNSVFWVKFFPAALGALTMVLAWKIIEELKGNLFALVLGAVASLLSVLLRINILYQPNSLDVFFWTLVYYTLIKYINSGHAKWMYAFGIALGFGILSKYNIVFLAAGMLPAVLLTPQRKILADKYFYYALLITLIIITPNLIWQYRNHFPTFNQLDELSRTQLVNVNRFNFLKDQLLYFISSLPIVLAGLWGLAFYVPFAKFRVFLFAYIITIAIYLVLKAKSYYAIGLYPALIGFGCVYLEHLLSDGRKRILRYVAVIWVIAFSIPLILLAFPYQSPQQIEKSNARYKKLGLLRWEDGKDHTLPQDFADMLGWSDLARIVDSVYGTVSDKQHTLVLCDNYGQAGAINYYSAYKDISASTYNADYINWVPLQNQILNVILVQVSSDDDPERQKERPLFEEVKLVGEITNQYAREVGTKVYLLRGAKVDINKIIASEIAERKP